MAGLEFRYRKGTKIAYESNCFIDFIEPKIKIIILAKNVNPLGIFGRVGYQLFLTSITQHTVPAVLKID